MVLFFTNFVLLYRETANFCQCLKKRYYVQFINHELLSIITVSQHHHKNHDPGFGI